MSSLLFVLLPAPRSPLPAPRSPLPAPRSLLPAPCSDACNRLEMDLTFQHHVGNKDTALYQALAVLLVRTILMTNHADLHGAHHNLRRTVSDE
eukprot:759935-Hanusia_phi.AAC.10